MWPLVVPIVSALASLAASWGGQKIADRSARKNNLSNKMNALSEKQNAASSIPGARGAWGTEKGGLGQAPLMEPWAQSGMKDIFDMGLKGLQDKPFDFEPIREKGMKHFYEEILPGIANKFASIEGDQRSSSYLSSLYGAGEKFGVDMAALEQDYRNQAGDRYINMAKMGSAPQYENMYITAQPSGKTAFGQNIVEKGVPLAADVIKTMYQEKRYADIMKELANIKKG